jgi:small-conductance mechanosensitive channel
MLRHRLDVGARHAVPSVVRYTVLLVGLLATVETVEIDLPAFNVMAGALGIGVGFDLQTLVSNFISRRLMVFERPVTVGDRIVRGGVEAKVWLREWGDDGVLFEPLAGTSTAVDHKGRLLSQPTCAIDERFNAEDIEFPFLQHELLVKHGVHDIRCAPPALET